MLSSQTRLTPNDAEVAAKIMDGELIMINLSTGVYYSMDKIGPVIWELIQKKYSLEEIGGIISELYDTPAAQVQTDLQNLVAELIQEKLVSVMVEGDPRPPYEKPDSFSKTRYEPPKLSTYRDMGDLLALDPPMPNIGDAPWTKSSGH